jgi:hypothetical protein
MYSQRVWPPEGFVAIWADVTAFVSVDFEMLTQMTQLGKTPFADSTNVTLDSFVEIQMFLVRGEVDESFSAFWFAALVVSHVQMNANVSFEMGGREKGHRAHVAWMISLVFVDFNVHVEIAAGFE